MGVKHEITNYTAEDLKHLASRLRFYADKYEFVVKSMGDINAAGLGLPNEKSLGLAMESLRRHVAETETALSRLLDMPPSRLVAEKPELFITPVGKNKPPVVKPKPEATKSEAKKRAE
jgi:hypothetical protein